MKKTQESEVFRDSIATIDSAGKREWIYPKKPKGFFYSKRKWVAFFLIFTLFLGPFITIDGRQLFLFNVIDRKFHFFGFPFWAQDFHLLVIPCLLV